MQVTSKYQKPLQFNKYFYESLIHHSMKESMKILRVKRMKFCLHESITQQVGFIAFLSNSTFLS